MCLDHSPPPLCTCPHMVSISNRLTASRSPFLLILEGKAGRAKYGPCADMLVQIMQTGMQFQTSLKATSTFYSLFTSRSVTATYS